MRHSIKISIITALTFLGIALLATGVALVFIVGFKTLIGL